MKVHLKKGTRSKYTAVFEDGKKVNFGAPGYSDYTKHKDAERKRRYIIRHKKNENWTYSGRFTAGFWSRWLLWNKETIAESKKNINQRFGIEFI